ncbi:hypothetical protein [Nocardiopsis dassonvillei]|uniref:hypothetical protein n=1 Tax=Nocardiopsis dassonvillei TaxID=2014 RepID=UPI00366DB83E
MSLLMVWLNPTHRPPRPPALFGLGPRGRPARPRPGHMRLHLSMTRTHGTKATTNEGTCPALDHTTPLPTDDHAPTDRTIRCRYW